MATMLVLPGGVARAATLTWDANALGDGQPDGGGAWLDANQWWDGADNPTWASGSDAVFGNGGAGGEVTLASPTTVGLLTMNAFTGTYTLGTDGNTITLNAGITKNATGAGAVTIISPVTLGAAQNWTNNSSGLLTVGTGAVDNGGYLLTVGGIGNTTIASAIGGSGGLTKSGAGTLVLSGDNTYTGATTVNAGTLVITGSPTGNSAVAANGGTLKLDYSTLDTGKINDLAVLTLGGGTVELAGDGVDDPVEVVASTTLAPGASTVIRSSGAAVLAMGAITPAGGIVNFGAENIATTTNANFTGILGPWAAVGGTDWARNDGSGNIVAYTGYTDIDARGGGANPDIVDGFATNVRIQSNGVSGAIGLSADTTTVNTLLQSNATYAATIDTAGKTLATGGIMIGSVAEALTVGASAGDGVLKTAAAGGNLILINNNPAKKLTVNAAIADNGTSGLSTAGNVLLNGANTYTGATTVIAGTLQAGVASVADVSGAFGKNSPVTMANVSGATLDLNTFDTQIGSLTGGGANGGNVTLGAASLTVGGDNTSPPAYAGVISSTGSPTTSLVKIGGGTLILTGANTYTGQTTVSAGKLQIGNGGTTGSLSASSEIANNGALVFNRTDTVTQGTDFSAASITGNGSLTQAGSGTLILSSANGYTGATSVTAGTLQLSHADAVSSSSAAAGLTLKGGNLTLDTAVNMTKLTLAAAGTVSGGTMNFAPGGSILFNEGTSSKASATITSGIAGSPTYTATAGDSLTLDSGTTDTQTLGNVLLQCRVNGTADMSFTLQGSTAGNSTGSITLTTSDNGNRATLNKYGSGTWTVDALKGAYNQRLRVLVYDTGRLIVKGDIYGVELNLSSANATLELRKSGNLFTVPSPAPGSGRAPNKINALQGTIDNTSGGLITFASNPQTVFAGDFTLSGDSVNFGTAAVTLGATRQVTVQNAAATMILGGVVSGTNFGLTKAGDGTLELRRDNTYTGPTVVNQGKLLVNNTTGSGTGTGSVTVNDGGTLGGTGTIGGAVTVASGGVLAPGAIVGTLKANTSVTMAEGAIYNWEFTSPTEADKVVITGNLQLDSGWKLSLGGAGTPAFASTYDLFTYTGTFTNTFAGDIISTPAGWPTAMIGQDELSNPKRIYLTFGRLGDTNGDNVVDAADFITLKQNFGAGPGAAGNETIGDFNNTGTVDWADLGTLTANMGAGGPAPATTPEPATLGLLAIGALAVLRRNRRS
jgi:autotransporter-associated beta strand protein